MALLIVLLIAVAAVQMWAARPGSTGVESAEQAQALKAGDFSVISVLAMYSTDTARTALSSYKDALPWPAAYRRIGILKQTLLKQSGLSDLKMIDSAAAIRGFDKATKIRLHREKQMWVDVYSAEKISPKQAQGYVRRINDLNLGPLKQLAVADVYKKAGMKAKAADALLDARFSAKRSMSLAGSLVGILVAGGLVGVVIAGIFLFKIAPQLPHASYYVLSPSVTFAALLIYLAAYFGLSAVAGVAADAARPIMPNLDAVGIALMIGSALIAGAFGLVVLIDRAKQLGQDWRTIGYRTQSVLRDIVCGIGGFLASLPFVFVAMLMAVGLSRTIFQRFSTPEQPFGDIISRGGMLETILVFAAASVIAPIVEETFFRGILFSAMRSRMRIWPSVGLSSVFFAIIHPLPGGFLPIFVLACVMALLRERSGSLLPSMVCHSLYNTIGLALTTLFF